MHPLLDAATREAQRYAVKPGTYGFRVWTFRDWNLDLPGWRILMENLPTREAAELHVLKRLGLTESTPPPPVNPPTVVSWSDPEWFR